MIPVLICGGIGTKLWPLSRENTPKHFLPLVEGKSLFQLNYEALRTHFQPDQIYISTNPDQLNLAKIQAPEVPDQNYIIEPEMRNQGPATGLIAAFLYKNGFQDEPFMIVQSDVIRDNTESFINMMLDCGVIAKREQKYITGGKKTEYPVMGVDYLIKGEKVSDDESVAIFKVDEFVWRSNKEQTEELIKRDGALIHTNHSCMTPSSFLKMLEDYAPQWHQPLMNYINGSPLEEEFAKMPVGPIEDVTQQVHKDGRSLVVELPFNWYDIGTFDSYHEYLKIRNLYHTSDQIVDLDGNNNFIKLADQEKSVALIGVEDLIVIDTGDVLLICSKKESGRVKEARDQIKEKKLDKFL